jgi:hypothetical protein
MEQKFKLPTETIELPSKGLLYPEENPLSSGKLEMKYMTTKEEDILTNQNYIRQGVVIDKLLQSMIVSDINYDDLLIGDKDAILIAARILGYGKDYKVEFEHPETGKTHSYTVDLTTIKEKPVAVELEKADKLNEFAFTLPNTKTDITFRLLTHGLDKQIDKELAGLKKIDSNRSAEVSTRLKYMITSVGGSREAKDIRQFVDNYLLAMDSRALREYMGKITPGMDLTYTFESDGYVEEGVQLPIGVDFFWPNS